MMYLGGVYSGVGKMGFLCCDQSEETVKAHTVSAWDRARKNDDLATYFIAPLQGRE